MTAGINNESNLSVALFRPAQWTRAREQNVRHRCVARLLRAAMHGCRLNKSKGIDKSNYYSFYNYCSCWPCTL